jgi:sensor histidine kinase YesM
MSIYGTLGFLVFMNQRTSDRMLEGVRHAELKRVQLDQHLVESRLATAEAQIDPATLFNALGEIKRGLSNREADTEKKLNDLIQTLRNALARTAAVSTERHES